MTQQLYTSILETNFNWLRLKLCGDAARKHKVDHKELFSKVLERMWLNRHKFKPREDRTVQDSFRSWANTLTYRIAIDMSRHEKIQPYFNELSVVHALAHDFELQIQSDDEAHHILKQVQNVYGELAYLTMKFVRHGYTMDECAALLNRTKPHLYRMLKQIRNDIKLRQQWPTNN